MVDSISDMYLENDVTGTHAETFPRRCPSKTPAAPIPIRYQYNPGMDRQSEQEPADEISETIVRAGAAGDRDALRRLYEATVDQVDRMMIRMVGRNDADDLTQQVYLKAFSKLSQFAGGAKFQTWLYRVATNEALQFLRARKHRETQPLLVEPSIEQHDALQAHEQSELIQRALETLDADLRMVLVLKEENGCSYEQIAEVMGIPPGTVGSRLNRARRDLRELLDHLHR